MLIYLRSKEWKAEHAAIVRKMFFRSGYYAGMRWARKHYPQSFIALALSREF